MTTSSRKYIFLCCSSCLALAVLIWAWNGVSDIDEEPVLTTRTANEMDAFVGEWVLDKNDNFDGMLKELGVNAIQRAIGVRLTTYMVIEKLTEDEYELKTTTGPVKKVRHLKFGVEFEDEAPTGGSMSGSWKFDDGKMTGTFYFKKDSRKMTIVRYLENGQLIEMMSVGDQTSRRTFKRKK